MARFAPSTPTKGDLLLEQKHIVDENNLLKNEGERIARINALEFSNHACNLERIKAELDKASHDRNLIENSDNFLLLIKKNYEKEEEKLKVIRGEMATAKDAFKNIQGEVASTHANLQMLLAAEKTIKGNVMASKKEALILEESIRTRSLKLKEIDQNIESKIKEDRELESRIPDKVYELNLREEKLRVAEHDIIILARRLQKLYDMAGLDQKVDLPIDLNKRFRPLRRSEIK